MEILKKFKLRAQNNAGEGTVTIAFLGDSVTQGCFECHKKGDEIRVVFDKESAYHRYLDQMFSVIYPTVPVNIINAGVSGGGAPHGLERLERDVLRFRPDLTVVCFGLNDCGGEEAGLQKYLNALRSIFEQLKANGSEIIFMTPNMMNTYVSDDLDCQVLVNIAEKVMERQNRGIMDLYMDSAKALCEEMDVRVCDCYTKWKKLAQNGADTTLLLSNRINHPTREMNWMFAYSLMETIFGD